MTELYLHDDGFWWLELYNNEYTLSVDNLDDCGLRTIAGESRFPPGITFDTTLFEEVKIVFQSDLVEPLEICREGDHIRFLHYSESDTIEVDRLHFGPDHYVLGPLANHSLARFRQNRWSMDNEPLPGGTWRTTIWDGDYEELHGMWSIVEGYVLDPLGYGTPGAIVFGDYYGNLQPSFYGSDNR